MRRKGFTLLELLIVMSIIVLLMSILLPCLMRAKEHAYEIFANQTQADEEGKIFINIDDPSDRKPYDDIYMIEINPPWNCHFYIKKPYPSGMKKIKRDRQDYIKWRPEREHIGVHLITVVFEAEKTFEKEIKIYVSCNELFEAKRDKDEEEKKH